MLFYGYQQELWRAINTITEETECDKFFAYSYGAHHFWLTHRKLSDGEPKEYRLKEELRAKQIKLAWLLFFVFEPSKRPKQRSKRKLQREFFP